VPGRIRDEDIALVREHSSIEDVARAHLQLRPAGGGQLKGLCPFHDEKTPSFHVRPDSGLFYCHGCGAGGDVISFVERIEHLNFVDAVESLARRAGIELHYAEGGAAPGRQAGLRQRLLDAHAAAAAFYQAQLGTDEGRIGRRFLAERGFDEGAAERFAVGYAPIAWDGLTRHLLGRGHTVEELITGGLANQGQRGPLDAFRGRLVWPIRDIKGEVIGFGARRLREDDDRPKYLNTRETPLFKKSHVLYGIDLAKADIARQAQAVVVEGYTDVMACHVAGVTTAVATCGTSFGAEHVAVLRRLLMDQDEFRGRVVFTFDGDEAGRKAALRAYGEDQRFVAQTFVAIEPGGLDPCELRAAKGDEAVRDLVANHIPLFEFVIRTELARHDLDTAEGRVAALDAAIPRLAGIKDWALRDEYARRLAGWLGMEIDSVRARARGDAPAQPVQRRARRPASAPPPDDPRVALEREALKLALQRPVLAGPVFDALPDDVFTVPGHAAVRTAVRAAGGAARTVGGHEWLEQLRELAEDDEIRSLVVQLAVEPLLTIDQDDPRYAGSVLARLQEMAVTRRIQQLRSRLQRLNPVEETEKYNRFFGDLIALEQSKQRLREQAMGTL
jgi:DNA primase